MSFDCKSQILISSDSVHIYADAVGDPAKPCIVFIHGFTMSGIVFDNIFHDARYNSQFYLVRYDMRGHGRSGKPDTIESYASQLYADDFAAVLRAYHLHKPVVAGWSIGATVIADIATHLPQDTIAGVVYLSGCPYIGPIMEAIGTPFILDLLPQLSSSEEDVTRVSHVFEMFADAIYNDKDAIPWETRALWRGMSTFQQPHHRRFALSRAQDPTKLFEVGAQGLPLLIIHGTRDKLIFGEVLVKEMRKHFINLEVCMIKDGGHSPHLENTEEVMDRISAFTRKVRILE